MRGLALVYAIEIEVAAHCSHFICNNREGGAGKLRTFARHSRIVCEHDATVGLLEAHIAVVADEQQSVSVLVGQHGSIYTSAVAFEIQVALLHRPEAVASGTVATGIGGQCALTYPLHAVNPLVEQEGYAQFGEEGVGGVGSQLEGVVHGVALLLRLDVGLDSPCRCTVG